MGKRQGRALPFTINGWSSASQPYMASGVWGPAQGAILEGNTGSAVVARASWAGAPIRLGRRREDPEVARLSLRSNLLHLAVAYARQERSLDICPLCSKCPHAMRFLRTDIHEFCDVRRELLAPAISAIPVYVSTVSQPRTRPFESKPPSGYPLIYG
jgi:hypothetical protein